MSDEPSSSPIHCDGEIKDNNKAAANDNNGSSVVVRRERPSRACTARSAARLYAAAAAEAAVVTDGRKQKSRRRPSRREIEEEEEEEEPPPSPPNPYSKIVTPLVREPPLSQLSRWSVRSMWELASILNFLNVFRPLLNIKVDFSVEEFETALITPNGTLGDIHIPLLKAIPPVTRMALGKNTWVTVLCRKLRDWWHWVAEGELPIVASHGTEIETYNTLDPGVRVVILKALCDIRVEQEDIRSYMDDSIKHGVPLSAFRKERTGGDSHGVSYWYEDDPVIGQRLYREIRTVEVKKGKGKTVQSIPSYQWETIATNLDEFQDVSEKLSDSKNRMEASLGKKLKNDMLPEIEKVHKRKEKLLKKQHREALLLDSMIIDGFGPGRSLRGRKPVSYTFDDYDRSINEAIKITKRKQLSPEPSVRREGLRHDTSVTNGTWGGPSQNSHQLSPIPSSPDSLNYDETDEDHASEQLDRSNRKRQRPQRYSAHEFVEAVSDNDAEMDSDDDIVGEAVYDEEYLKQRKGRRKMSSSSEGDEEYHWDEENAEEEERDDSFSASENSDVPQKLKKLRSRTRREAKVRSVGQLQSGLRRSKRATRNRIDYTQYEFSESEHELTKPEKSTYEFSESEPEPELAKPDKSNGSDKNTEASNSPGFSMGSDNTEVNNDNGNDNNHDHDHEEVKMDQPVIEEHQKMEKEDNNETSTKIDNPVQDEFARKRRFLDLNELAPSSGFDDGSMMKDEDTDNV